MFISLVDANYDGGLGKANIRYMCMASAKA